MSLTIKEKIRTIIQLISEPKVVRTLISFRSFGYLLETGWLSSFREGNPVDSNFKPIPWFTYSAIDFLSERLNNDLSVFEFGCGNSSLFFAERVGQIVSVEHNKNWFEKISNQAPVNSKILLAKSDYPTEYIESLKLNNQKYDIIIVDGIYRNDCIIASLKHLSELGVIILDDSERSDYTKGISFLIENGFRQIIFSGVAPGIFFRKCTTIFYKDKNCFNI